MLLRIKILTSTLFLGRRSLANLVREDDSSDTQPLLDRAPITSYNKSSINVNTESEFKTRVRIAIQDDNNDDDWGNAFILHVRYSARNFIFVVLKELVEIFTHLCTVLDNSNWNMNISYKLARESTMQDDHRLDFINKCFARRLSLVSCRQLPFNNIALK